MNFDLLTIEDLGILERGRSRHRPRDDKSLYGGIYPFIQTGDVKHAPFYISSYSQTYNEKGLAQSKLWGKGTLCITIAANIADTAFLGFNACFPDSILGFTPYKTKSDAKFIKYCFDVYKTTLEAISKGTTQDNLSLEKIKKVRFKIPALHLQRKIAAVLSAYDDLIENNNRRIAILEKMAEELYREWFVRLRFPGHEKVKIVKGVPEGWEVKKIGDCFQTSSGGTPSRKNENDYYNGNIEWIKTGELRDTFVIEADEKITELGLKNSSAKLFPSFILIMAMYGVNIGQLGIALNPFTTNQACCVFLPINTYDYPLYYLFFYLKSIREFLFNISMGAAQQNLSQEMIKRIAYLQPPINILTSFERSQNSMFKSIVNLKKQTKLLSITRDRLLTRLMSGKIDLENLDIKFPQSMLEEEAGESSEASDNIQDQSSNADKRR